MTDVGNASPQRTSEGFYFLPGAQRRILLFTIWIPAVAIVISIEKRFDPQLTSL
jgi:hypothetical protein